MRKLRLMFAVIVALAFAFTTRAEMPLAVLRAMEGEPDVEEDSLLDDLEDVLEEDADEAIEDADEVTEAAEDFVEDADGEAEDAVEEFADEAEDAAGDFVEGDAEDEADDEAAGDMEEADVGEAEAEDDEEAADEAAGDDGEEVEEEADFDAAAENGVEEEAEDDDEAIDEAEDALDDLEEEVEDEAEDVAPEEEDSEEEPEDFEEEDAGDAALLDDDEDVSAEDLLGGGIADEPEEEEGADAGAEDPEAAGEVAGPAARLTEDGIDPNDPDAKTISDMAALERIRKLAVDKHGDSVLEQADQAMLQGRYEDAIKNYKQALEFIRESPANAQARARAREGWLEAHYLQAQNLKARGNYTEALRFANNAKMFGHPQGDALAREIKDLIDNPPPPAVEVLDVRHKQPQYKEKMSKVTEQMKRAREFYATGEYDLCRDQLELIMHDDPFNTDAIEMMRHLADRRSDVADKEAEATRREMMYDVREKWTPRRYAEDVEVKTPKESESAKIIKTTEAVQIQEKMKKITIPEINFRQANLVDVITFLGDASREFDDPSVPAEERGINIVLGGGLGAAAAAQANSNAINNDDPFGMPSDPVADVSMGGPPPITFQARYVTLYDALSIVMAMGDLKYRIRGTIVMVMPSSAPDSELLHRMYNVLPTISERIIQFKDERRGSGDSTDPFILQTADIAGRGTDEWKDFFKNLGVDWPEGSSIQHMPAINKLVVRNTADNLATLESVLAELNVTPRQVEIEARFVEVQQADLESLGFEWILNNDWEMFENKKDAGLPLNGRRRVTMSASNLGTGFNYLSSKGLYSVQDAIPVPDNVLQINSVLTNPEVSMILHMISQCQNTDLLSAPKVVAKTGSEAVIKVVREYIYPTAYSIEVPENSGDGGITIVNMLPYAVVPESFETREVGVILQVVPEVSEDGQLINLTLAPQVVDAPEWYDYGYDVDVDHQIHLPIKMPFFPVRSIATSIQVYNGATVVMGGMITENRIANKDKVPILGDIPILGRLFRYEYDSSQKRNLLIFVTAKLVDPAGRAVRGDGNISVQAAGGTVTAN